MAAHKSSQEVRIATTVAIGRDKNSQHAVKWAVDNLPTGIRQIVLLHVHAQMQPQGDAVSQKIIEDANELQKFFLPYRGMCARKGVQAKEVLLIDLDIASALAEYISENSISAIVLGAANRNALTRAFKNLDIPSSLAKSVPDFCTIYAVSSRGKVQILKLATRTPVPICQKKPSLANLLCNAPNSRDLSDQEVSRSTTSSEFIDGGSEGVSFERSSRSSGSFPNCKNTSPQHPVSHGNDVMRKTSTFEKTPSLGQSNSNFSDYTQMISYQANDRKPSFQNQKNNPNIKLHSTDSLSCYATDISELSGPPISNSDMSYEHSDASSCTLPSQATGDIEEELRRLRQELKRTLELFKEANTTREKEREINEQNSPVSLLLKEKRKSKAAAEVALVSKRIAELESQKRRCAELKFDEAVEEKKKALDALAYNRLIRYRKYSIKEIEVATNHFALPQKIGEGGYGPVFKGFLDHIAVAIKVLRPDILQGLKQFHQEIELLRQTRHPNIIMLLGACPEYGCLVYEYMANGSLHDRLLCRNGTPPIPWRTRFRIAAEVALALHFLHQTKPTPVIHHDINPQNVLLDGNFVSKISDGLSRIVPTSVADSITQYNITSTAQTLCYIDPQYQQTGKLTTKSDIYSLGILLLQIITASSPGGLSYRVGMAIQNGVFSSILDPAVHDWPISEALSLAKLALKCCELRGSDRPDLGSLILPELEQLRDITL